MQKPAIESTSLVSKSLPV